MKDENAVGMLQVLERDFSFSETEKREALLLILRALEAVSDEEFAGE